MLCKEKCEPCSPSLSIFSILVTANMPVEGFSSFVYDPNDTMPYKNYLHRENGNSQSSWSVGLDNICERDCAESCPPGGGWNCAGDAAGTRATNYTAQADSSSSINVNITAKGNYRNVTDTKISRTSRGTVMTTSWARKTEIKNKYINGMLDPSSTSICAPASEIPNTICGYDPVSCEQSCSDYPYTQGGCSNSTSDIPGTASTCITSKTSRTCNGNRSFSASPEQLSCEGDSYSSGGNISSREALASQVTEAEILSMARQAATRKVNLKKQNQNTGDENQDITEDGSCCRFIGECDGSEEPYPVDYIGDCNGDDDDCSFTSVNELPTTCNCSEDKDECWGGYYNITTPSEFSYTNITIGAFKIATNINKEKFSKEYKSMSGKVYFYIDSESEPETTPCCTSCGGIECFTGEILGTSSYSISAGSNEFKQNTRIAVDLDYSYDSSELYAIHPGKVIKVCYTVDNLEFF